MNRERKTKTENVSPHQGEGEGAPQIITVKLGLYINGSVRTLGYNVLSVDHGHRESEKMYIFRIRRKERGTISDNRYQFFPPGARFCPFFGSSIFLITGTSSTVFQFRCQFLVALSSSWCPERQFHDTRSEKWLTFGTEKHLPWRIVCVNQNSTKTERNISRYVILHMEPVVLVRKIAFCIKRTLFITCLFSFPLRVRNNRVLLYSAWISVPSIMALFVRLIMNSRSDLDLVLTSFCQGTACSRYRYTCKSWPLHELLHESCMHCTSAQYKLFAHYTLELFLRPSQPSNLYVHIEFDPGVVGKDVLRYHMASLRKRSTVRSDTEERPAWTRKNVPAWTKNVMFLWDSWFWFWPITICNVRDKNVIWPQPEHKNI